MAFSYERFQKNYPGMQQFVNTAAVRGGINEAKWAMGFGPSGLFNRSIFDPLVAGKGWMAPIGRRAQAKGYAAAFKHGSRATKGKFMLGAAGRALGPAFVGYSAFAGYREGGIFGAIRGGSVATAESFAWGFAWKGATAILGSTAIPVAVGVAAVAGLGYGTYKALEHGNQVMKKQRRLEMGSPIIDPFGTGATMRNRSLNALQNSQINGRSAFGSEAALMHVPTMR